MGPSLLTVRVTEQRVSYISNILKDILESAVYSYDLIN